MRAKVWMFISILAIFPAFNYGQEEVHHFELALTWPNGYFKDNPFCYGDIPQDFTIHGLWPIGKHGTSLTYCESKIDLKKNDVKGIKSSLATYWPSLTGYEGDKSKFDSDFTFWKAQWNKHGTCSNMSPTRYFSEAMNLRKKVDLLSILGSSPKKIKPGQKTYTADDIIMAIESQTQLVPIVVCKNIVNYVIVEIRVCVSPPTEEAPKYEFMSCPGWTSVGCNGNSQTITFTPQQRFRESSIFVNFKFHGSSLFVNFRFRGSSHTEL